MDVTLIETDVELGRQLGIMQKRSCYRAVWKHMQDTSVIHLHLQTASPAIDTGDNAAVPVGVTTDLDGNLRFIDGDGDRIAVVDIGAYEWQLYKYKFYLFPIFK